MFTTLEIKMFHVEQKTPPESKHYLAKDSRGNYLVLYYCASNDTWESPEGLNVYQDAMLILIENEIVEWGELPK